MEMSGTPQSASSSSEAESLRPDHSIRICISFSGTTGNVSFVSIRTLDSSNVTRARVSVALSRTLSIVTKPRHQSHSLSHTKRRIAQSGTVRRCREQHQELLRNDVVETPQQRGLPPHTGTLGRSPLSQFGRSIVSTNRTSCGVPKHAPSSPNTRRLFTQSPTRTRILNENCRGTAKRRGPGGSSGTPSRGVAARGSGRGWRR